MESSADQVRAFLLALAFHVALIALIWWSASWVLAPKDSAAAGEPIQATLQVSAADLRRARAAIKAAPEPKPLPPAETPATPPPQPIPEPSPQTSDTPVQMTPQAPQERPDTVDQERISKLAQEKADRLALEEQEERRRQEQVDLTDDVTRQEVAERRQRLREQLEAIRRERTAAARRTLLEEQRLQQLADMQAASPTPAPRAPATPPTGNRGTDEGLLAQYKTAMTQNADGNWNHTGAPELTHCQVRFTQIPGGEVINVEFMDCPYDAQGRDSVERALRKTPMPYSGFEKVFLRQWALDFCYPREECSR
jgi:colicin import membrane protein